MTEGDRKYWKIKGKQKIFLELIEIEQDDFSVKFAKGLNLPKQNEEKYFGFAKGLKIFPKENEIFNSQNSI